MKMLEVNSPKHGLHKVLVDDEDYEYLNQFKWHILKYKCTFYAAGRINGSTLLRMHRVIMNVKKNELIDHKDRNGLNNQKNNLRRCTRQENRFNSGSQKGSSSIYKGVSFLKHMNKWAADIFEKGKITRIGIFEIEKDAAIAYNQKASLVQGEFAYLNPIDNWQSIVIMPINYKK